MILHEGIGLPSDEIRFGVGFFGNEDKKITKMPRRYIADKSRAAVVFNTFYPEIQGGYYLNKYLFDLLDDVLRRLGLHIVSAEYLRDEGLVPLERASTLDEDQVYHVIGINGEQKGILYLWHFSTGGGGAFYGDDQVIDVLLPTDLIIQLGNEVEGICRERHVMFLRHE